MTFIEHYDLAMIALYAFWGAFALLILYLRNEDRREGYPLVHETSRGLKVVFPKGGTRPKTFLTMHGLHTPGNPEPEMDGKLVASRGTPGSPYLPAGDPMQDGVGTSAYALRADVPDVTFDEQLPKIVPLRAAPGFDVSSDDFDPRGWPIQAADGEFVGMISDLWVDRSDVLLRYLEVTIASESGNHAVIIPISLVNFNEGKRRAMTSSVTAAQFRNAPGLAQPTQVTLREEDRISAYFAGGYLYATPRRSEPCL
jgi:photosynthetic reaction center H subunit